MAPGSFLSKIVGFDWDERNLEKNWVRHRVSKEECEQVFFNTPLRFFDDNVRSGAETRYGVLGKTNAGRKLTVVFTVRSNFIRIISAYNQGKKDQQTYDQAEK